MYGVYIPKILS